jgi:hypothetical protein
MNLTKVGWQLTCINREQKYLDNTVILMVATPKKKDSRFNADFVLVGEKPVPESTKKLLELVAQKNREKFEKYIEYV